MDKEKIKAEIERRKSLVPMILKSFVGKQNNTSTRSDVYAELLNLIDSLEEEPDCVCDHTPNNPKITIGTKIRSKTNPNIILSIISNDCHGDEFECSNGSVLSLKQIENIMTS